MKNNVADFGQLGNAAALREAVEGAKKKALYISRHYTTPNSLTGNILELLASLNAALAEPPRNCDVGTAEEQYKRFLSVHLDKRHYEDVRKCPLFVPTNCNSKKCCFKWGQMPYEGGAK